jgi:hypothetical protein
MLLGGNRERETLMSMDPTRRRPAGRRSGVTFTLLLALLMLLPGLASAAAAPNAGAPNPNAIADVEVTWECDGGIVVTSSKEISNLVLVIDGEPVKIYDRASDEEGFYTYTIDPDTIDGEISGIYVKSGANGVRGPRNRGFGEYFSLSVPEDCLATGSIQATLRWHSDDDLDLEVTDPAGDTVAYYNPTVPSGGFLDVDANVGVCEGNVPPAVENIVWPDGQGAPGTYTVRVLEYNLCAGVSPTWNLVVLVDGVEVLNVTSSGEFTANFTYP